MTRKGMYHEFLFKAFTAAVVILAALVCVPQSATAAIFGNRSVSKTVVVQRGNVRQQNIVVQRVVAQPLVVRQRVVQQQVIQSHYAQPFVQQFVVPQAVYAPQAFQQQVVAPGCSVAPGQLQLNAAGCAQLYGR